MRQIFVLLLVTISACSIERHEKRIKLAPISYSLELDSLFCNRDFFYVHSNERGDTTMIGIDCSNKLLVGNMIDGVVSWTSRSDESIIPVGKIKHEVNSFTYSFLYKESNSSLYNLGFFQGSIIGLSEISVIENVPIDKLGGSCTRENERVFFGSKNMSLFVFNSDIENQDCCEVTIDGEVKELERSSAINSCESWGMLERDRSKMLFHYDFWQKEYSGLILPFDKFEWVGFLSQNRDRIILRVKDFFYSSYTPVILELSDPINRGCILKPVSIGTLASP